MFLSEWREFPSALCLAGKNKKPDDSSRLDVNIARDPDMLPSLFPSWSGQGLISTTVNFCNRILTETILYASSRTITVISEFSQS
jgi:hypothetical protein